jgi:tetratricopeptide (TPR) repeat protein
MAEAWNTHNEITGGTFISPVVQGRDITVQLAPETPPALAALPACSPGFTGRDDELESLLNVLAPPACGEDLPVSAYTRMVVVNGLAGVGKTELAAQAAHIAIRRGWFPGGVLFTDMFGYDVPRSLTTGQALEGFLRALGVAGEHIPPTEQDRARVYTSALAAYAGNGRRILVIVDNVSAYEQAAALLPVDGINAAIVTSRDRMCMLKARQLSLDVLAPQSAIDMLGSVLQVTCPDDTRVATYHDDAAKIAEMCGRLPLALHIAGALLADDPARPLASMIADLSEAGSRLDELKYDDIAVVAAFGLSYSRLDLPLARLFRLLPVCPGPHISVDATAVLCGIDTETARRQLNALSRAHLIEPAAAYAGWRMHDLVRLYADQQGCAHAAEDERERGLARLLDYYLATARAASGHLDPQDALPADIRFSSRSQALKWLDLEYPNLIAAERAAGLHGYAAVARDLPLALWKFLMFRRHFNDWITLASAARDAARHLGDRHGEAMALNALGIAFHGTRRFEDAIAALHDAIQILPSTGDGHGEAMALNNLGVALQRTRRFKEAAAAFRRAARAFRDSGDRHGEGIALSSLGYVTRYWQPESPAGSQHADRYRDYGNQGGEDSRETEPTADPRWFTEAIEALQDGIRIFHDAANQHGEGRARENLGIALREAGRLAEAAVALREAAVIFRGTGDRHSEGLALSHLSIVLQESRRYAEAIAPLQEAIQIFQETGDKHSEDAVANAFATALCGNLRISLQDRIRRRGKLRRTLDLEFSDHAVCKLPVELLARLRPEDR